jgi:hypothetical protein
MSAHTHPSHLSCRYGPLVRLSDDRKKATPVFCILLPLQLCFYSSPESTSQLKGRIDLDAVERMRRECVRPNDESWARQTDKGYKLRDDCSFEVGDASFTTILFADETDEADEWLSHLRELVAEAAALAADMDYDSHRSGRSHTSHTSSSKLLGSHRSSVGMMGEGRSGRGSIGGRDGPFAAPTVVMLNSTGWRSGVTGAQVAQSGKVRDNYESSPGTSRSHKNLLANVGKQESSPGTSRSHKNLLANMGKQGSSESKLVANPAELKRASSEKSIDADEPEKARSDADRTSPSPLVSPPRSLTSPSP